jgi:hypothetical protein
MIRNIFCSILIVGMIILGILIISEDNIEINGSKDSSINKPVNKVSNIDKSGDNFNLDYDGETVTIADDNCVVKKSKKKYSKPSTEVVEEVIIEEIIENIEENIVEEEVIEEPINIEININNSNDVIVNQENTVINNTTITNGEVKEDITEQTNNEEKISNEN